MKKDLQNFFKTSSFKLLIFGSIFNILLLLNLVDPYVCFGRQCLVILGSLIHYRYYQQIRNISMVSEEVEEISLILKRKYPVLKVEPLLIIWVGLSTLGQLYIHSFSEPWVQLIYTVSCPAFLVYCSFMALKFTILLFGKDAREVLFPSSSMGNPNFTGRRFSTSSKVVYFCKACVQGCAAAGLGTWGIPKITQGDPDYRGVLFNTITYPFTGYKSYSEWLCQQANRLWLYDHNVIPRITGEDGYLCPTLVDEEYKRLKIARPKSMLTGEVGVDINHRWWSPWWK